MSRKKLTEGKCAFCGSLDRLRPETSYCAKCTYRESTYQDKYGLSLVTYRAMLADQEGRCAICNNLIIGQEREPAIDHCHETLHIRGLLCITCNIGLGCFQDNENFLKRAIVYLVKNRIERTWWYQKIFKS